VSEFALIELDRGIGGQTLVILSSYAFSAFCNRAICIGYVRFENL